MPQRPRSQTKPCASARPPQRSGSRTQRADAERDRLRAERAALELGLADKESRLAEGRAQLLATQRELVAAIRKQDLRLREVEDSIRSRRAAIEEPRPRAGTQASRDRWAGDRRRIAEIRELESERRALRVRVGRALGKSGLIRRGQLSPVGSGLHAGTPESAGPVPGTLEWFVAQIERVYLTARRHDIERVADAAQAGRRVGTGTAVGRFDSLTKKRATVLREGDAVPALFRSLNEGERFSFVRLYERAAAEWAHARAYQGPDAQARRDTQERTQQAAEKAARSARPVLRRQVEAVLTKVERAIRASGIDPAHAERPEFLATGRWGRAWREIQTAAAALNAALALPRASRRRDRRPGKPPAPALRAAQLATVEALERSHSPAVAVNHAAWVLWLLGLRDDADGTKLRPRIYDLRRRAN